MLITPFTTPRDLAHILEVKYSSLIYRIYKFGTENNYRDFDINKKNGDKRKIYAPSDSLKNLQQRLHACLESLYKPHSAATAFIRGRGIVYNANKHTKKYAVLNIDLECFYEQIHFGRIRGMLMAKPYSLQSDTAMIIAHICCLNGVLPQGAPTSPIISNMICYSLDKQLSFLAKKNRAYYSRYADDMTFSFRKKETNSIFSISDNDLFLGQDLINAITKNGFVINSSKTRIQFFTERQIVTGLKVNRKVNVDRRYIRTTRAMIHSLFIDVEAANQKYQKLNGSESSQLQNVVLGRLNYISMVKGKDSSVYQGLAKKYNSLGLDLVAPLKPSIVNKELEQKLHFYSYEHKNNLARRVWVVEFEGIEGISITQELTQGTAFMLKGNILLTCAHTFDKAGNPNYCYVYRITDVARKYRAELVSKDNHSDVAQLLILEEEINFPYLRIAKDVDKRQGYKVSLVGFPQKQLGHNSVTVIPSTIVNTFQRSKINYVEIDAQVQGGLSGGPVVNAYMEVVGMVVMGTAVAYQSQDDTDDNKPSVPLEGNNAYISAAYFPSSD